MLLKIIINIITLGGVIRRELAELKVERDNIIENHDKLKVERDNMHDALHSEAGKIVDLANDKKELKLLIDQTNKVKEDYETKPTKMVPVEYFEANEPDYLRSVSEAYNSKPFRHFVYNTQQDIFAMLGQATPENALEVLGMVKGMNFFIDRFHAAEKSYRDSLTPSNQEDEDHV